MTEEAARTGRGAIRARHADDDKVAFRRYWQFYTLCEYIERCAQGTADGDSFGGSA